MEKVGSKRRCDGTCGRLVNTRCLYRKEGREYCGYCIKKFRRKIILGFLDSSKPPKDVVEGQKNYRKSRKVIPSKEKPIVPTIRGVKRPRSYKGSPYIHLYLTKTEKYVLYKKYVSIGLTEEQARERLENETQFLKELITRMKNKGVEEKEINRKFKEEFAKLTEVK